MRQTDRFLLIALTSMALTSFCADRAAAAEPDTASLLQPLQVFAAAYNRADCTFPADAYTDDATTIDEFAPFSWQGPRAARTWYAATTSCDKESDYQQFLAEHQVLTLGALATVRQEGNHAFVVIATKLTFQAKGRTYLQHLYWTVSEIQAAQGWRIAAQGWALVDEAPMK